MKHLEDVDMTYLDHMRFAIINSFRLLKATVALMIHAILPCIFCKTASNTVRDVVEAFRSHHKNDRILIRFNTKWQEDPDHRKWRVLVNGIEQLAHKVIISVECDTIEEPVEGVQKYHFHCVGEVRWEGDTALVL